MSATLQPQRWPLIAFLAVFFLALMASARSASRTRSGPASWWRGGNPSRCMVAEELLWVGLDTRPRCPIGAGRGHRLRVVVHRAKVEVRGP